jgi:small subunit ribosomal protein S9
MKVFWGTGRRKEATARVRLILKEGSEVAVEPSGATPQLSGATAEPSGATAKPSGATAEPSGATAKPSSATAEEKGEELSIKVNGRDFYDYFGGRAKIFEVYIKEPFLLTNTLGQYKVIARINGGGISGQLDALKHGISRALVAAQPDLRPILRKNKFLTRDPRVHERKKYGRYGRRRGFQWTKR